MTIDTASQPDFLAAMPSLTEYATEQPADFYDPELYGDRYYDIDCTDGERRAMQLVSYFDDDPKHNALTERIIEGRWRAYVNAGWWDESHPRDDVRGPNVEILALVDPATGEPLMSLRKVHVAADKLEDMPCFSKFEEANAFDATALSEFRNRLAVRPAIEDAADSSSKQPPRTAVEVCCLWKDPLIGSDGKSVLEIEAMTNSFVNYEMWFIAMVTPEYRFSERAFGQALHNLGQPIAVHEKGATQKLRIRPVWLDSLTFYEELLKDTAAQPNAYSRRATMHNFLGGLASRPNLDGWQQKKVKELIYQ